MFFIKRYSTIRALLPLDVKVGSFWFFAFSLNWRFMFQVKAQSRKKERKILY